MNTTPSWDDLRVLLAVHRHKSFLAAGKALGVATSTVARRIEALEREVGRSLVHRGNDGTQLDPDAAALVSLGEQLELGLLSLRRDGRESEVSGTVRVSLSEGFVRPVVRALARLRVKHPELSVELISESRLADLARREADIGIRIVRTASPAVVHKPLGSAVPALFAARDYVDRRLPGARLSRESAAGIRRTTWALEAGLNISYSVLYLGGGASFLNFEDTRPLRVTVMPEFGGGPTMKRTAKAKVGGGFAEAGLTYRFFVALGQPGRRREQQGFALQPALGYGFQGMATVRRTIASCADCTRDEVADYHAGQYLRFQFGVQYASCVPLASVCGYLGVNPSYKRYFDGPTPQLERYIEIAVTLGFAYPNVRTR